MSAPFLKKTRETRTDLSCRNTRDDGKSSCQRLVICVSTDGRCRNAECFFFFFFFLFLFFENLPFLWMFAMNLSFVS